ncbi:hypothetical protein COJ86_03695 [Bacillus cereus]|nr:hypothetical protein COJ86_03695 [Bacillus cereus]
MRNTDKTQDVLQNINKAKNFQEAYDLFQTIPQVERKNNVFNTLINKAKTLKEASALLEDMKRNNISINDKIFRAFLLRTKNETDVLSLLEMVDFKHHKFNKTTYREILLKFKNYKIVQNIFYDIKALTTPSLDMYQVVIHKTKSFNDVIPYLNELKELDITLDERTCSTVINKAEHFSDAILFVYEMIDQNIKVRQKIYSNLISLTSNENEFEELTTLLNNQGVFTQLDEEIAMRFKEKKEQIEALRQVQNQKVEKTEEKANEIQSNIKTTVKKVDHQELKERYTSLYERQTTENSFYIIDSNEPLQYHINFLSIEIDVVNMFLATGFLYKSGLELIAPSFEKCTQNKGQIEMVVGSLQKYNRILQSDSNKIHMMDKATAKYLDEWLRNNQAQLKTIENRFFHGKFYLMEGREKSCVLIGSSNLSSSGFMGNHEFNVLYIVDTSSSLFKQFKQKFNDIWSNGVDIKDIDAERFMEMTNEHDHFSTVATIRKLEQIDVRNRIEDLSEEQVKKRLKMWMQRNPNNVYSDLGIVSLKGYILFEYKDYDLWVLESFEAGNAYYYFRNVELEDLIKTIKPLSKTDIFHMSDMQKRGYHIKNESSLELSIASLFIRKIVV